MRSEQGNTGLSFSLHEGVFAVVNQNRDCVTVHRLDDGGEVRTFGGHGRALGQFNRPQCVCFTDSNTLLVTDRLNNRVQELELTGHPLRTFGELEGSTTRTYLWGRVRVTKAVTTFVFSEGARPVGVAAHGATDRVAVTVSCKAGVRPTGGRVLLFQYSSRALVRRFGDPGESEAAMSPDCVGVRFTPDGSTLLVADRGAQRVCVWTVEGAFMRHVSWAHALTCPSSRTACTWRRRTGTGSACCP